MKCGIRGCPGIPIEAKTDWQYLESGLSNVVILSLPILHCLTCESKRTPLPGSDFGFRQISRELLVFPRALMADEIAFLQKEMRLRDSELSFKLKRSMKELRKWLDWTLTIDPVSDLRFRLLAAERIFCEPEGSEIKEEVLRMFRREYQEKAVFNKAILLKYPDENNKRH